MTTQEIREIVKREAEELKRKLFVAETFLKEFSDDPKDADERISRTVSRLKVASKISQALEGSTPRLKGSQSKEPASSSRRITPEQSQKIRDSIMAGNSDGEIADRLKVKTSAIYNIRYSLKKKGALK